MLKVADIQQVLNELAPPDYAADWDNTGLLLGSADGPANRILTCLTVTPDVVEEALAEQVELIVTHHPILFRPMKNLTSHTAEGRLLLPLLRAGIAVYSPHTRWDDAPNGINDQLAQILGLMSVRPLIPSVPRAEYKLVVFVPTTDLPRVSAALFTAGAGQIGNYRECSFRLPGTGTFLPLEGANPTLGAVGQREEVSEFRLEVLVPEPRLEACIQAMKQAHSYEEVAFDVYPLKTWPRGGVGRVGDLTQPQSLRDVVGLLREKLGAAAIQTVGPPDAMLRRVAIVCGSGGKFVSDAMRAQADAFLTGEASFHDCLASRSAGMSLILPGHYATERPAMVVLAQLLQARFPTATVWASRRESDPLTVLSTSAKDHG